ncbi:MAG: hypothetical protein ACM3N4_08875 [Nitrososphaerota archaeon]
MTIPGSTPPAIEQATLYLYQLYDTAFGIDLERAHTLLKTPTARVRPVVTRGGNIEIPQLPLEMSLGDQALELAGMPLSARIHVRIYDLGILAFRMMIRLPGGVTWDAAAALLGAVQSYPPEVRESFQQQRDIFVKLLQPAMERPYTPSVRAEDYAILMIEQLGEGTPAAQLARDPVILRTALGERKQLSASAAQLATSFSYYEDDVIVLTWNAAVVVEPDATARDDVALLLEFANAQLLAFRSYDAEVERDLARVARRVGRSRRPRWPVLLSSGSFLREIHGLIADITETSARVENALKVTEDVYWNRVYAAALTVLRVEVWRTGIAETVAVLRETAALLRDEAQEVLAIWLEVLVIVLIAIELVVALLGLH